jgi:protein O-mannosyl-transferase
MKIAWSRIASREKVLAVTLLLAIVALLYGHTLHAPFYLDDPGALTENYRLRDLSATLTQFFSQRGLTNLTFALNFHFTGWDLPPLHLTNIALHALCGILVWLLLCQLIPGRWLPLLGALLFVAHPLQTQAVTYLVQRSAVLGGCFFIAAVLCHRQARSHLAAGGKRTSSHYLKWYVGAVLSGACAVLAKENTATLPLLLLAHDRFFPLPQHRDWRQFLADYLPYCVVPLFLGVPMLLGLPGSGLLPQAGSALASLEHSHSLHYLVTQFSVFWIYLRLLLLPYGQGLEYDYPIATELLTLGNGLALAGLLSLGYLVWRIRRSRPLLAFGAVWFFLALAVESSLIPLDPLFEHRLYLPMFGFILILLDGLPALLREKRAGAVLGMLLLVWMPLTWCRNALWNDPIRFKEENLRVAPRSERAHLALILDYKEAGRIAEATECAKKLLRLNSRFAIGYEELALLYAAQGEAAQGLATVEAGLNKIPGSSGLYKAGAKIYLGKGEPQAAVQFLQQGVTLAPQDFTMLDHLAALYFELGELGKAEATYRESLQLNESSPSTHRNLGKVLYSQGQMAMALEELRTALRLEPGNPDAWEGLGMSALALGDTATAVVAAERLDRIDAEAGRRLRAALAAAGQRGRR